MKKTLVALAALATVGAAFAQSSVTLYGRIDATIVRQTAEIDGVKTAGGNVGLQVNSAGLSGSRWGMRGTEDLGGGLNAVFQLESGFSVDDGRIAQGGASASSISTGTFTPSSGILFGRQAFVGFTGGFGTFTIGRQYSPLDNLWSAFDAQGQATNSALTYSYNKGIHNDPARIDNSVYYKTPAFMGGFWADVMLAPGENRNPVTGRSAGSYAAASVGYANGPIGVGVVYERTRITSPAAVGTATPGSVPTFTSAGVFTPAAAIAADNAIRDWTVGASYDFGVAKLFGSYQRATNTASVDDRGWSVGVGVPIGPMSLVFGYVREDTDASTTFDGRSRAFAGTLVYPLSKRTNVYADFLSGKTRAPSAAGSGVAALTTKNTIYGVGMRHDF